MEAKCQPWNWAGAREAWYLPRCFMPAPSTTHSRPLAEAARRGLRLSALAGAFVAELWLSPPTWIWLGLVGVAGGAIAFRLHRRDDRASLPLLKPSDALALFGLAVSASVRFDHSLSGPTFSLALVMLVITSTRMSFAGAGWTLAAALGLLFGASAVSGTPLHATSLLLMVVATAAGALLLRRELTGLRLAGQEKLSGEIERLRDEARAFRLSTDGNRRDRMNPSDEDRLARASVHEVRESVFMALQILQKNLGLHSCLLLWLDVSKGQLRITERVSDDPTIGEGPFSIQEGLFSAVLTNPSRLSLSPLRPTHRLPYYTGACPVGSACIIPVFQQGAVRGLLIADRINPEPFDRGSVELFEQCALFSARMIETERLLAQTERTRIEQSKLYRAAGALGSAVTEEDVIEAGLRSAREIADIDFAAVTLYEATRKSHEIRAVSGTAAESLVGQRFRHNTGLVSMVFQNRHPLPYRGEYDPSSQVVFTKRLLPPELPALVVLPLLVHDAAIGTLVLASRRPGVFSDSVRSTLEVLASHLAVSLSNSRMVRRLEQLATLDGLTGLLNKRAILEIAEDKLNGARRFKRRLSLIVADIDHFKKVNDTYGHDVGDEVIKKLAEILRRSKRVTDSVARFGGEEFVVLCEETDAAGAHLFAERVREELEATAFMAGAPQGGRAKSFRVTCSLGIASFPENGTTWTTLFKAADEALYQSKRGGRNRATIWTSSASTAA